MIKRVAKRLEERKASHADDSNESDCGISGLS
jgi:hypothetical protein